MVDSFEADIFSVSLMSGQMVHLLKQMTNTLNISFKTLYYNQFALSTQLIIPNYSVILSQWYSSTVSLESYLFC